MRGGSGRGNGFYRGGDEGVARMEIMWGGGGGKWRGRWRWEEEDGDGRIWDDRKKKIVYKTRERKGGGEL